MQRILATLRAKSPDQLQFEFACRSLKIGRPWILDQLQVQLSLATVRRILRRLGLIPQRPQRRATRYDPAAVQRWKDEEFPQILRRAQELGVLIAAPTSPA